MASIDRITVDGTGYDIKDTDGRALIEALKDHADDTDYSLASILEATSNLNTSVVGRYYIDSSTGRILDSSGKYIGMKNVIPCSAETDYNVACFDTGVTTATRLYAAWYTSTKQFISIVSYNRAPSSGKFNYTFTSPANAAYMATCAYNSNGINETGKIMVSASSAAPSAYVDPFSAVDDTARALVATKQDILTFDNAPTEDSNNPVKSGGVYSAVNSAVADALASVSLISFGVVSQEWLTENEYTNIIDLPAGYAYAIPNSLTIGGKPTALQSQSFTLMAIKCGQNTLAYDVYLAIGRNDAYYALRYQNDTAPAWVNFKQPVPDNTLTFRWGSTARKIVLLGDSIVQGYGSSDYSATGDTIITIDGTTFKRNTGVKSWGAQFKAKLEAEYYGITVVNNGLPQQGITVITDNLDDLIPEGTTAAIVCVGINSRNSGATAIQNAYIDLFNALNAKGISVFALSPVDLNGATYQTSPALMNTALENACNTCEVPYYNLYGEFNAVLAANTKADYYSDTIHPNDKGYATMYGLICKLLNM